MLEATCGAMPKSYNITEIDNRLTLIGMLVDLMVYDLASEKGGTSQADFEECIAEFMLEHYNVEDDMDSIEEMANMLMTVRQEFS